MTLAAFAAERRRSAANAASVMLRADGGGSTQTCFCSVKLLRVWTLDIENQ